MSSPRSGPAEFLTPLRSEKIGAKRILLIDELVFWSAMLKAVYVVSRGFQSDLASIPRIAWTVFPPTDIYDPAAVLHDAAYGNAIQLEDSTRVYIGKEIADNLFREALTAVGVGPIRTWLMYQAVHQFGTPDGHPLASNHP